MDEETLSELEQIAMGFQKVQIDIIAIRIDLLKIHRLLQKAGIEVATKGSVGAVGAEEPEGYRSQPTEGRKGI